MCDTLEPPMAGDVLSDFVDNPESSMDSAEDGSHTTPLLMG